MTKDIQRILEQDPDRVSGVICSTLDPYPSDKHCVTMPDGTIAYTIYIKPAATNNN